MSCCGGESIQNVLDEIAADANTPRVWASIRWREVDAKISEVLHRALCQWIGTKYQAGQRACKGGVDCTNLVPGIFDKLYKLPRTDFPRMNTDAGIHNGRNGFKVVMAMRRVYPCCIVRDGSIEPGDVVVTRATPDPLSPRRISHAMIADVVPYTAVHAVPNGGVCRTSLMRTLGILRVYRLLHKERWVS